MPNDLDAILSLEVPIIVRIGGRCMTLSDVVALSPGAIIELPKRCDESLEILANNRRIGTGTAVKVGENFGVRVTGVGDTQSRVEALAGSDGP